MAACLRSRFLAMSRSSPPSSASTSLNAVRDGALFGRGGGSGIAKSRRVADVELPIALAPTCRRRLICDDRDDCREVAARICSRLASSDAAVDAHCDADCVHRATAATRRRLPVAAHE